MTMCDGSWGFQCPMWTEIEALSKDGKEKPSEFDQDFPLARDEPGGSWSDRAHGAYESRHTLHLHGRPGSLSSSPPALHGQGR